MSHKPYEDLIFAEENLTDDECRDLQEHLQNCSACEKLMFAMQEINAELKNADMVDPEPHFVNRWQARFEADRRKRQTKQNRLMVTTTWGFALAAMVILVYIALPLFQAPKAIFFTYIYQLIGLVSVVNFMQDVSSTLLSGSYGDFPYMWLVLAAGIITEIGVLWIVSIRYLTNPRRVKV